MRHFASSSNKMAAPSGIDMELKKAFQEVQTKMVNTTQQIKISDMQIETLKRQIQHSKLVHKEVNELPESTRVFEGVGRMFVLTPAPDVKKHLEEKQTANEEKIKSLQNSKAYLERSIKESENGLRELVLSKQQGR